MKAQQIKDLITSKIAGQGNQVDCGGALSTILDAIVDAIGEIKGTYTLKAEGQGLQSSQSYEELVDYAGLTDDVITDMVNGVCLGIYVDNDTYFPVTAVTKYADNSWIVQLMSMGRYDFSGAEWSGSVGAVYAIKRNSNGSVLVKYKEYSE